MNPMLAHALFCAAPLLHSAPLEAPSDIAALMPAEVEIYAEAPGFSELCRQGLRQPLVAAVLESPLGDLIREEVGSPGLLLIGLSVKAGRPVLPTLAELSADGLAIGLVPRKGAKPIVCVAARGDADEWESALEFALAKLAESQGLPPADLIAPQRTVDGMHVWELGDFAAIALDDGLFLAASDAATLERMIALRREAAESLATNAEFQRARGAYRTDDALLWSWLDLAALEASADDGLGDLRKLPGQPAAQLLFGSTLANLGGAKTAALELRLGANSLELDVVGIDAPEGVAAKLVAPRKTSPPALPAALDGEAARGSVYRDFASVFRERVELFPPGAQPAFAEATSNLALFFGGQDIADDVLPKLEPWIGFVSRPVVFDERAVPEVPLPGAAILVRTTEPETMGPELVAAVQSLLAVLNIEAAQNQQPILTVNLELHEGTTITYGRYRAPVQGEGVDVRYNLEPACAMVGDTFVLGTHRALVKELAGQLVRGELTQPPRGESLELSGAEIARVIAANEETLVLGAVLDDGKSEEQARKEIGGLVAVAGLIDALRLETARPAARDLRASLKLLIGGAR